jgi:hypothetical protein
MHLAKAIKMSKSTIHQAKTQLSRLIEEAERGEEVVILRGKKPVGAYSSHKVCAEAP